MGGAGPFDEGRWIEIEAKIATKKTIVERNKFKNTKTLVTPISHSSLTTRLDGSKRR